MTPPLRRTDPDSVEPKFVPVIVTIVPDEPVVGEIDVIVGSPITLKEELLLVRPLVVTTTFPEVAPGGTPITIAVLDTLETVAARPLSVTVASGPKFVPAMVTVPPGGPLFG